MMITPTLRRLAPALSILLAVACTPRPDEPAPEHRPSSTIESPPPSTQASGTAPLKPKSKRLGGDGTIFETESTFSHFFIKDRDNARGLYFVRDSGEIVLESELDKAVPHHLLVAYTRVMFVSYLLKAEQKSSLIVGLGGGSMVHFLNHYEPDQKVDVVEIDPAIVEAADRWFGVKSTDKTKVITEDAFVFLKKSNSKYDAIYMDAFLKPSAETDDTGVPLRMKTVAFLKDDVISKLNPGGVVVFNVNGHDKMDEDLKTIQEAFGQAYFFPVPDTDNFIVAATMDKKRLSKDDLKKAGEAVDARLKADFSFKKMAGYYTDKMTRGE